MAGLPAGEDGDATSSSDSDSDEEEEEEEEGRSTGAGAGGGDVGRVSSSTSTPSSSSTIGWTAAGGLSTGADSSSLADEEEDEGTGEAGLSEERWST